MLTTLGRLFLSHLEKTNIIFPHSHCLLAISGGGDSVALAYLFKEVEEALDLKISAVHLDHQLREESGEDRDFVRQLCKELNYNLVCASRNVGKYAEKRGMSIEEAGRVLRYKLFNKVCKEQGADYIVTAHTGTEQAETLFMRLITGTGITGLCSIRPKRKNIVRPLLPFRRETLRQYLLDNNHLWKEDATNLVPDAPRTKVRLILLPLLEKWNNKAVENANKLADLAYTDEKFLGHFSKKIYLKLIKSGDIKLNYRKPKEDKFAKENCQNTNNELLSISVNCSLLTSKPQAVTSRVIRILLRKFACKASKVHLDAIIKLMQPGNNGKLLDLPNKLQVCCCQNSLTFSKYPEIFTVKATNTILAPFTIDISSFLDNKVQRTNEEITEISYTIPLWNLNVTLKAEDISARPTKDKIYLNPKVVTKNLTICSRENGDYFYPAGGLGKTKIKKYFNELKIPQNERDLVPILKCKEKIVWVIGHRADQRFLAKPMQNQVISIKITNISENFKGAGNQP